MARMRPRGVAISNISAESNAAEIEGWGPAASSITAAQATGVGWLGESALGSTLLAAAGCARAGSECGGHSPRTSHQA